MAPLEPVDLVISLEGDARVLVDNVVLSPDDAVDGMDPKSLTLARESFPVAVRFGGNLPLRITGMTAWGRRILALVN